MKKDNPCFQFPCLESALYFNENVPFPSEISNAKTRNSNSGKIFPVKANRKHPFPKRINVTKFPIFRKDIAKEEC